MSIEFKCLKCGNDKLVLDGYVRCRMKVMIDPNEHVDYGEPQLDFDDFLSSFTTYACGKCGKELTAGDNTIYNEGDMLNYLRKRSQEQVSDDLFAETPEE